VGGIPFLPLFFQSHFILKFQVFHFIWECQVIWMFLEFSKSHFIFLFKGSFQLPSMEFILSYLNSNSFYSNEELLEEIVTNDRIVCKWQSLVLTFGNIFTSAKLNEKSGHSVNLNVSVRNILATMWATLGLFNSLTNFTLGEFEKLAQLVVPTIISHVRSTREP